MARSQEDQFNYIGNPVQGIHQSPSRSLMIISRMQGFDPTKIVDQRTGESIDVANFDYDPGKHTGVRDYVGTLPEGVGGPDIPDSFPNAAPAESERVTWNSPNQSKETADRHGMKGGDPFAGMGGQ